MRTQQGSSQSPHNIMKCSWREPIFVSGTQLGGGRAGSSWGTSVGGCIAAKVLLAMASVWMRAMRRSGAWHFEGGAIVKVKRCDRCFQVHYPGWSIERP